MIHSIVYGLHVPMHVAQQPAQSTLNAVHCVVQLTMKLIWIALFVFIIPLSKGACVTQHQELYSPCSGIKPHCTRKCYGNRIGYYANSDATFQLLLLKSGDVSPNPGPSEPCADLNQRITYDVATLHNLKLVTKSNCNKLANKVFNRIKALGILRKRKTHRGSRGAGRKIQQKCSQPMYITGLQKSHRAWTSCRHKLYTAQWKKT